MPRCHCGATDEMFGDRVVRRELRRYRKRGPGASTAALLGLIESAEPPKDATLLDIGGGIGGIHHRLLDHGFSTATHVDASLTFTPAPWGRRVRMLVRRDPTATDPSEEIGGDRAESGTTFASLGLTAEGARRTKSRPRRMLKLEPFIEECRAAASATDAEKAVREANDETADFTTIVVRPRFVWGPGDQTILPVVKAMVEKGQFAWIDGGRNKTSTTYIGNLVHAMNLALTKGQGGEAYFVLDGEPVVFREFMTKMLKAGGQMQRSMQALNQALPQIMSDLKQAQKSEWSVLPSNHV